MPTTQYQADLTKFRWSLIADASLQGAPTDGVTGTDPTFTLKPFTVSKMPTTGLLLVLQQPSLALAATAGAGGFSITAWLRDPVSYRWASFSAVSIAYDQLFVSYDIDAGEIYFQIGNIAVNGSIDIGIAEQ